MNFNIQGMQGQSKASARMQERLNQSHPENIIQKGMPSLDRAAMQMAELNMGNMLIEQDKSIRSQKDRENE